MAEDRDTPSDRVRIAAHDSRRYGKLARGRQNRNPSRRVHNGLGRRPKQRWVASASASVIGRSGAAIRTPSARRNRSASRPGSSWTSRPAA